jgi:alpha-ketoglutarate-dependent taurine dioxygenase
MLDEAIKDGRAWTHETLSPVDWLVPLPDACVNELDAVVERVRRANSPATSLEPDAFAMEGCKRVMARVQETLQRRAGFAVIDRIPVERYALEENRAIGWLLARLLGRVVAQSWTGTYLYDVKDSGKALGYGVRRSVTNLGQPFHTDGGWLWMPPAVVGLLCLQSGQEGGESRVASLVTAHNEMRQRHPALLRRLYAPFRWDRQAEHAPDDTRFATHPVYASDGGMLVARWYEDYIVKGQALAGEALDAAGTEALAAMREILDAPEHWVEFRIERGQFQFINNRQFAHCRAAFRDDVTTNRQRHMIRIWNRDEGAPEVEGRSA